MRILFLAHRIPYPPNKGDKIRGWRFLDHLARAHEVHLGCLIDDPADHAHEEFLRERLASAYFARLRPRLAKARALPALAGRRPLSFPYFHDAGLNAWVAEATAKADFDLVFAFSSGVAPYLDAVAGTPRVVVDFCDVDSDKWRQYAASKSGVARFVYGREARTLEAAETEIAARADASLFISEAEAALFRARGGVDGARVHAVGNGVDLAYFDPTGPCETPYPPGGPAIAMTGAMDYWANADAALWFARKVMPKIRARAADARFFIVGGGPGPEVRALDGRDGVTVTGRVADMRPYIARAALAVAPLRIARGVQNKVLEAMAMGRPVLATPMAHEGIAAEPGRDLMVVEGARETAAAAVDLLTDSDRAEALGRRGRALVERRYDWARQLADLDAVVGALASGVRAA